MQIDFKKLKNIKNLKRLKYHILAIKHYFFLLFVINAKVNMKKNI